MKTRITKRALGALVGIAWLVAGSAHADVVDCQRTIGKETQKFLANKSKTFGKCEQDIIKGKLPFGTDCAANLDAVEKIAKFEDKMRLKIEQKCAGVDLSFLGGSCPDLEGLGCDNAIADESDVADCMVCLAMEAVDQVNDLVHANLTDPAGGGVCEGDGATPCKVGQDCADAAVSGRCVPTAKSIEKCQQTISKETQKFLAAKSKELSKCWDLRLKGKHNDVCPDENADPKSKAGKAAAKIAKAMQKMDDKICKACGGPDKVCGGTDGVGNANDILPTDIGVAGACPDVTVPGGGSCSTVFTTTQQVVDCLTCVSMFKADCMAAATYPSEFGPYPGVCNPVVNPSCTSADIQVDVQLGAGDATGVNVEVNYPGTRLELVPPVMNESIAGTFLFGDNDTAPLDGLNDQMTAGLIAIPGPIPAGSFASAVFNCRGGQAGPDISEFSCTADASDINGQPVSATCTVSLNVVP